MISSSELINKIKKYHPDLNQALIQRAYVFSKTSHGNQTRHSGELYFSHPLAVAEIAVDLKLDQASVITALLHDVVEDTEITLEEISEKFGEDVAMLVDGVTKLGKLESASPNERLAENFRKLTLAMAKDIRVLLVKLCDRLHNMRTLFYVPSNQQKLKKAKESLEIYAPLAGRIGLGKIRDEIQDLAFEIMDTESNNYISNKLRELQEKNKNITEIILNELQELLKREKIDCEVVGRLKRPYSIWNKMKEKNIGFHNLNDIMAFRIITQNLPDCYKVLGVINSSYSMIPGSFKDYISTPKDNGYRSLHLVSLGPVNKKIEIQIRDKNMHEICELGVAAHWSYKENSAQPSINENNSYRWIRDLILLFENAENSTEVLKNHKLTIHQNEVFCYAPSGEIYNLPFGSTVLDFAYAIHSEIGHSCVSSKVNGVTSPLRQKIENGDQIEIITDKSGKPSSNWLQFVITSKAKSNIRHYIRNEKFSEYRKLGWAILNKFFISKNLKFSSEILEKTLAIVHVKNIDDLCVKVAEGSITRRDILKAAYPEFKDDNSSFEKDGNLNHQIEIEGLVPGMAMKFCSLCNPIPGDEIVGIINVGTGVTIHSQECSNFINLGILDSKILYVSWKDDLVDNRKFTTNIKIIVENQLGSLAEVSSILARKKININNIKISNRTAVYFELLVDIEVQSKANLEEIISSLRLSEKIREVNRI